MSFVGMGPLEIGVILLIAFIILGPEKMVESARWLGKMMREVRKMVNELPDLNLTEDDISPTNRSGERRNNGTAEEIRKYDAVASQETSTSPPTDTEDGEDGNSDDAPVAFRPGSANGTREEAETETKQEQP